MSDEMPSGQTDLHAAGGLLATVVHDLRNPLSTIRTNLDFVVREPTAADTPEALEDAQSAVLELVRGLDQVIHLSRALMGEPAYDVADADVVVSLRADQRFEGAELVVEGDGPFASPYGGHAPKLVLPLFEIARATPGARLVRIRVRREGACTMVAILDDGVPLATDVAEVALTPVGPRVLRDRASPRRGRYGGLYALGAIAKSVGVELSLGAEDGLAVATLAFPG